MPIAPPVDPMPGLDGIIEPLLPTPSRVLSQHAESGDTVTVVVEAPDGMAPPLPGQFSMLWAFGVGEVPISVSGITATAWSYTIRRVGVVTDALAAMASDATIGVRGPFGSSWPLAAVRGRDLLLVAGGLGLAPLRPVVEAVVADRASYGRVALLVGARSPDALLFADDLHDWRARLDLDVEVTVDQAASDWRGDVGVVTKLFSRCEFDPGGTSAFLCGPEIMMRFAAAALADRGVEPSSTWVSLERNMKCAVALCGRCQLGPTFVCREGPVLPYDVVGPLMAVREL